MRHRFPCRKHVLHIGIASLAQWRRHRNNRRVTLRQDTEIGRGKEPTADHQRPTALVIRRLSFVVRQQCQPFRRNILHIRLAAIQRGHLAAVHFDADDGKALLGEGHGQRQPHVAQADDGHDRGVIMNLGEQLVFHRVLWYHSIVRRSPSSKGVVASNPNTIFARLVSS
ncbi:MAG: hypothetical protein WBV59_10555, partial [Anaerolineae bacterium]